MSGYLVNSMVPRFALFNVLLNWVPFLIASNFHLLIGSNLTVLKNRIRPCSIPFRHFYNKVEQLGAVFRI